MENENQVDPTEQTQANENMIQPDIQEPASENIVADEGQPIAEQEAESEAEPYEHPIAEPYDEQPEAHSLGHMPLPESARRERPKPRDKRKFQKPKREFTRYVTVLFSGQREPVDDMYVCDIQKNGEWLTVTNLELFRTRREVLDYLKEVDHGLVGLDFPFSFPQPFIETVRPETKVSDWRGQLKVAREELKKNIDDGVRKWIERIGRYRESQLAPEDEEQNRFQRPDPRRRNDNRGREPLPPYERRSMAERFRRTEHNIRRPAEGHVTSALQIGYNRLTSRYEFGDARQRGRAALLGMALLDQWLEFSDKVKVWPWSQPDGGLVVVEIQPWLFTHGKTVPTAEFRKFITMEEDNALEIDPQFKDLASRNPLAQQALMTTLGMMNAEARVERAIRPLRDYPKEFYTDPRVLVEGWYYGVGYKPEGAMQSDRRGERGDKNGERQPERPKKGEVTKKISLSKPTDSPAVEPIELDSSFANDLDKVSVVPQAPEQVQTEEVVEAVNADLNPDAAVEQDETKSA